MLRGAAPANSRAARPTVTRVGLVPAEELESSSRSPRAGIGVADKTQQNSNERPTQNCNESSNECPQQNCNGCSNESRADFPHTELTELRFLSSVIDLPERGGGSVEQTSLSTLIGQGLHGVRPFWVVPQPNREAHPPPPPRMWTHQGVDPTLKRNVCRSAKEQRTGRFCPVCCGQRDEGCKCWKVPWFVVGW